MFSILVNPLNASTAFLKGGLAELSGRAGPPRTDEKISAAEMGKIMGWAHNAGAGMAREMLVDFIRSAQRRLNRDVKRVYEYYETMREEIDRRARRKMARVDGPEPPVQGTIAGDLETMRAKREAVEAERDWKIRDLVAKYTLRIKLEPLCAIRIQTRVPVFTIRINLNRGPQTKFIDVLN
jgi:hypothetical protein